MSEFDMNNSRCRLLFPLLKGRNQVKEFVLTSDGSQVFLMCYYIFFNQLRYIQESQI